MCPVALGAPDVPDVPGAPDVPDVPDVPGPHQAHRSVWTKDSLWCIILSGWTVNQRSDSLYNYQGRLRGDICEDYQDLV